MKTVKIEDLKIGDSFTDGNPGSYGYYVDNVITSITRTKGGRFHILYSRTYIAPDGTRREPHIEHYSNGAVKGTTLADIK